VLAKCRGVWRRNQEAWSASNYTGQDRSNNVRIDRRRVLYSAKVSEGSRGEVMNITHTHEICQRAVHITKKEVPELHRV
jgi:hypothetical protein